MPPKKRTPKAKAEPAASKQPGSGSDSKDPDNGPPAPSNDDTKEEVAVEEPASSTKQSKKRKKAANNDDEPQKAARRSGRGGPKAQPSQEQLLNFMLSKEAEELCRPEDETAAIRERGSIQTYSSSVLNPFEELLCAVILSRPISHRLGLRAIRTVLNAPYNFTSAKAVKDAGKEKHHQALFDAKTQHKAKTAEQIGQIAEVVLSIFTSSSDKEGTQLQKVRDECKDDVEKEREMLKKNIKGLGNTGLDIFFRRVQWQWESAFPFVDGRTSQSLRKLGLPEEEEDLQKLIEQHWNKLDTKQLAGSNDSAKKRRGFVVILERATGADLEGKSDALMAAAAQ